MQTAPQAIEHREVTIPIGDVTVTGSLAVPTRSHRIVVCAPGSGSGPLTSRHHAAARVQLDGGLATLVIDLLTPAEERKDLPTVRLRFDVPLLAERVIGAIDWLVKAEGDVPTAAALIAAAGRPSRVEAVASRGGRPALAADVLPLVGAPTVLVVGANDSVVIELNRRARAVLAGESRLEIVPRAGHLFEDPGALERVIALTRARFGRHLGGRVS